MFFGGSVADSAAGRRFQSCMHKIKRKKMQSVEEEGKATDDIRSSLSSLLPRHFLPSKKNLFQLPAKSSTCSVAFVGGFACCCCCCVLLPLLLMCMLAVPKARSKGSTLPN